MTVKPETSFWKSVKKSLEGGKYIVSRLESYVTPGFPDCLIYNKVTGFFTVELKLTKANKLSFSPHQIAFHIKHPTNTYILAATHDQRCPILYPGAAIQELAACGLSLEARRLPLEAWSGLEACLLLEA